LRYFDLPAAGQRRAAMLRRALALLGLLLMALTWRP
jgi:hypothetical protein